MSYEQGLRPPTVVLFAPEAASPRISSANKKGRRTPPVSPLSFGRSASPYARSSPILTFRGPPCPELICKDDVRGILSRNSSSQQQPPQQRLLVPSLTTAASSDAPFDEIVLEKATKTPPRAAVPANKSIDSVKAKAKAKAVDYDCPDDEVHATLETLANEASLTSKLGGDKDTAVSASPRKEKVALTTETLLHEGRRPTDKKHPAIEDLTASPTDSNVEYISEPSSSTTSKRLWRSADVGEKLMNKDRARPSPDCHVDSVSKPASKVDKDMSSKELAPAAHSQGVDLNSKLLLSAARKRSLLRAKVKGLTSRERVRRTQESRGDANPTTIAVNQKSSMHAPVVIKQSNNERTRSATTESSSDLTSTPSSSTTCEEHLMSEKVDEWLSKKEQSRWTESSIRRIRKSYEDDMAIVTDYSEKRGSVFRLDPPGRVQRRQPSKSVERRYREREHISPVGRRRDSSLCSFVELETKVERRHDEPATPPPGSPSIDHASTSSSLEGLRVGSELDDIDAIPIPNADTVNDVTPSSIDVLSPPSIEQLEDSSTDNSKGKAEDGMNIESPSESVPAKVDDDDADSVEHEHQVTKVPEPIAAPAMSEDNEIGFQQDMNEMEVVAVAPAAVSAVATPMIIETATIKLSESVENNCQSNDVLPTGIPTGESAQCGEAGVSAFAPPIGISNADQSIIETSTDELKNLGSLQGEVPDKVLELKNSGEFAIGFIPIHVDPVNTKYSGAAFDHIQKARPPRTKPRLTVSFREDPLEIALEDAAQIAAAGVRTLKRVGREVENFVLGAPPTSADGDDTMSKDSSCDLKSSLRRLKTRAAAYRTTVDNTDQGGGWWVERELAKLEMAKNVKAIVAAQADAGDESHDGKYDNASAEGVDDSAIFILNDLGQVQNSYKNGAAMLADRKRDEVRSKGGAPVFGQDGNNGVNNTDGIQGHELIDLNGSGNPVPENIVVWKKSSSIGSIPDIDEDLDEELYPALQFFLSKPAPAEVELSRNHEMSAEDYALDGILNDCEELLLGGLMNEDRDLHPVLVQCDDCIFGAIEFDSDEECIELNRLDVVDDVIENSNVELFVSERICLDFSGDEDEVDPSPLGVQASVNGLTVSKIRNKTRPHKRAKRNQAEGDSKPDPKTSDGIVSKDTASLSSSKVVTNEVELSAGALSVKEASTDLPVLPDDDAEASSETANGSSTSKVVTDSQASTESVEDDPACVLEKGDIVQLLPAVLSKPESNMDGSLDELPAIFETATSMQTEETPQSNLSPVISPSPPSATVVLNSEGNLLPVLLEPVSNVDGNLDDASPTNVETVGSTESEEGTPESSPCTQESKISTAATPESSPCTQESKISTAAFADQHKESIVPLTSGITLSMSSPSNSGESALHEAETSSSKKVSTMEVLNEDASVPISAGIIPIDSGYDQKLDHLASYETKTHNAVSEADVTIEADGSSGPKEADVEQEFAVSLADEPLSVTVDDAAPETLSSSGKPDGSLSVADAPPVVMRSVPDAQPDDSANYDIPNASPTPTNTLAVKVTEDEETVKLGSSESKDVPSCFDPEVIVDGDVPNADDHLPISRSSPPVAAPQEVAEPFIASVSQCSPRSVVGGLTSGLDILKPEDRDNVSGQDASQDATTESDEKADTSFCPPDSSDVLSEDGSCEESATAITGSSETTELQSNISPILVRSLDDHVGIEKGDIMISLLNGTVLQVSVQPKWAGQVQDAIWRSRTMRRNFSSQGRDFTAQKRRSSLPVDVDEACVAGGIRSIGKTQEVVLELLKNDEVEQAMELYEGIIFSYYSYFDRALKRYERNKGGSSDVLDFRPYIGMALHNIGIINLLHGDFGAALSFFHRAAENRKACLGKDHVDYVTSIVKCAICQFALDDYERAQSLLEEALDLASAQSSTMSDQSQIAEILNNLGCLTYMCGESQAATKLFQRSLEVQLSVQTRALYTSSAKLASQSASLNIATTRANIGYIMLAMKHTAIAIAAFEASLMQQQLLLHNGHESVIATMDHLVVAQVLAGNRERALQMLGRTLQAQLEEHGPKDGRFRVTLNKIKLLRNDKKSLNEVLFELQRSLAMPSPPGSPSR